MKALVIGAGPSGCSMAYYLRQRGDIDVDIVESDEVGGCSKTSFYANIPYEFGPQIMYTDEPKAKFIFEKFLKQHRPSTYDGEYHPALSPYGNLKIIHDFPITISNVMKLPDPSKAIYELYTVNLNEPDYSNFENYVVSRIGRTLYEMYVENYNIKQWKIHPRDMDADWARFRALTLRELPDMFGGKWQGHPGNYNPLWRGMISGCNLHSAVAKVSEDFKEVFINGDRVNYDLVFSSLPLSGKLSFINTCIVFVVVNSTKNVMPSYATSFPNNYDFTRIVEYKQQFNVRTGYSLLSFEFPFSGVISENKCVAEAKSFCKNIIKKNVVKEWVKTKENTYPVSTRKNLFLVDEQLELASNSNVIPIGRSGVHAYVSKDTCMRMAWTVDENFEDILNGDPEKKLKLFRKMREKLS